MYKVLIPFFLFVGGELVEKVDDPCSEFQGGWTDNGSYPLVKCPSEKPEHDYLECYDLFSKYLLEHNHQSLLYFCWKK